MELVAGKFDAKVEVEPQRFGDGLAPGDALFDPVTIAAERRRADLTSKIITAHAESDRVYGSPRILADLREAGEQVTAKTVARLMRWAGVVGISPRGFVPVTTQAGPDPQPVPDLVKRHFDQDRLNKVWTSDITYLATGEGWIQHHVAVHLLARSPGDRGGDLEQGRWQ